MPNVESSFQNPRVFSINDEFIVIIGWENPNNGVGTNADKGTLFIEKTCNSDSATFWIKKNSADPQSWNTWSQGSSSGSVVIAPSATQTVDTVAIVDYDTAKWLININDGISKSQSYTMEARAKGIETKYTRYAIIGDKNLQFTTFITSDGTTMIFSIQNNELNPVTVKYNRIAI